MNTIYLAGLERGLSKPDMQRMTVGEIVDFVEEFNRRQKKAEKQQEVQKSSKTKSYRFATPKEAAAYHRG